MLTSQVMPKALGIAYHLLHEPDRRPPPATRPPRPPAARPASARCCAHGGNAGA